MRDAFDIILVSDEAALYDGRSFAGFTGLCAVHLVWRVEDADAHVGRPLERRMRTHCHPALRDTVQEFSSFSARMQGGATGNVRRQVEDLARAVPEVAESDGGASAATTQPSAASRRC